MRKPKVPKHENHERYLITYADLITLLLVFFIVLYAGSQDDSKKFAILAEGLRSAFNGFGMEGGGGNSPLFTGSGSANQGGMSDRVEDFQAIVAVIERMATERNVGDRVGLRNEQDRIVIDLKGDLLFASGSAAIRPSAEPVLDAVAAALRGNPNEVRIEGHTDAIPLNTAEFASNWELSAARATAVARRLVEQGGLPANRVFAAAYGDTRPKADNRTPEGRAANRRAEIVVLYPGTPPTLPAGGTPRVLITPSATPAGSR